MESIRTHVGFYGRKCKSYLHYIFGFCQKELPNTLAGEHCKKSTRGMYFVQTNSQYPYARGQHGDMRATRMDDNQLIMKNLDEICNGLDDDDEDDLFFWEFLNCSKFLKKVYKIPKSLNKMQSTSWKERGRGGNLDIKSIPTARKSL